MINLILDGIKKAINDEFGDEYHIYQEGTDEVMQTPYFLITPLNTTSKKYLNRRIYLENKFSVKYVQDIEKPKFQIDEVYLGLLECLEYIIAGSDITEGTQISGNKEKGVLNVSVNYNFFINKKIIEDNKIESLDIHSTLKE